MPLHFHQLDLNRSSNNQFSVFIKVIFHFRFEAMILVLIISLLNLLLFILKQKPDRDEWGSCVDAMQAALALEKSVNQALLDLHKVAASHGDEQVSPGEAYKNLS